jgi:hypothetical protein
VPHDGDDTARAQHGHKFEHGVRLSVASTEYGVLSRISRSFVGESKLQTTCET